MKDRKVLLLGLDGACFDFIDPLVKGGKLPTFKKLLDKGVRANLKSTIPPSTIPAWPAILTGLKQAKLGCFGHERWEKLSNKLEPVSMLSWKGKLLWDIISETKKVGVFRIPALPKSYPINGFIITDIYSWSGSSYGNVYPKSLFEELQTYWINKETESLTLNAVRTKLAFENFRKRIEVAKYLLEHKEMSLFVMIARIPDIISHFTTNLKRIELTYRIIDQGLNKILDKAQSKDYDVIIVSDHGTGRMINNRICVNSWLLSNGYLAVTNKLHTTKNLFADRFMEFLASKFGAPFVRSIQHFFQTRIGKEFLSSSNRGEPRFQWEKTKAFSYGGGGSNYTGIHVNRTGLFPHGIVSPQEYETLRNDLCYKLKRLKDHKSGVKVIDGTFLKEQIFNGPNMDSMPDIVLKTRENYRVTPGFAPSILCSDKDLIHTENGILIAYGSAFRKRFEIKEVNTIDIAPTILHILGIPIPKDMDGKVLQPMFSDESQLAKKEIKHQETRDSEEDFSFSEREKEEIKNRLRALGYI